MKNQDDLRRAAEGLLPQDADLSASEVTELLREAGADPEALAARLAAGIPLESCAAFQALLPAYRAGTLPAARKLLLEDHLHHCVACRHALHPGAAAISAAPAQSARRSPVPRWAYAAAAAIVVIAAAGWAGRAGLLPGQSQTLATLTSGGGVYAVAGAQVRPVRAGYTLANGQELRTGTRSGAQMQLRYGTRLEMGRRTAVMLTRGWSGTTVHLLHGDLIVRASDQGWGRRLHVATADSRITDQGTVFAVARGLMGSRVAVAEGRVRFAYTRNGQLLTQTVLAGQEATSNERLGLVPLDHAFDWSENAGQYLAMLSELRTMGRQLDALESPAPRYNSVLLSMVPGNAALYAAIPNLNQTLTQTQQILNSNLGSSPALQDWWNKADKSGQTNGEELEAALTRLQQITGYLGDEIAFAAVAGRTPGLVVLASVTRPGLAEQLESQPAHGVGAHVRVLTNPAEAGTGRSRDLLVWIGNHRLVATHNGALLAECAALAQSSGPGPFPQSALYQKVAPLYQAGASWILAASVNQLRADRVHRRVKTAEQPGSQLAYIVARSTLHSGGTPTEVELDFAAPRTGLAAALGAPGPMAGLQFLSPQTTLAVSLLTESPAQFLVLGQEHRRPNQKPLTPAQQQVRNDFRTLADSLGGEFTVAQDGPVLPQPAWKAIVEVNDTLAAQDAIQQLVHDANALAKHPLQLQRQSTAGQTFYTVQGLGSHSFAYAYAGSYLVAGSDISEVENALQTYASGTGLPSSTQFQEQLPQNGHTSFSALFYRNMGTQLAPLAQSLLPSVGPTWRPEVQALFAGATPGLTYAYAQPSSITIASQRGLLGLTLQDLLGFELHAGHKQAKPKP